MWIIYLLYFTIFHITSFAYNSNNERKIVRRQLFNQTKNNRTRITHKNSTIKPFSSRVANQTSPTPTKSIESGGRTTSDGSLLISSSTQTPQNHPTSTSDNKASNTPEEQTKDSSNSASAAESGITKDQINLLIGIGIGFAAAIILGVMIYYIHRNFKKLKDESKEQPDHEGCGDILYEPFKLSDRDGLRDGQKNIDPKLKNQNNMKNDRSHNILVIDTSSTYDATNNSAFGTVRALDSVLAKYENATPYSEINETN